LPAIGGDCERSWLSPDVEFQPRLVKVGAGGFMSEESSEHQRSAWKADSLLGLRASREEIEKLRAVWPAAFPEKSHLVRPLTLGLVPVIAERMGWTRGYARGVLQGWKARYAYCNAVLGHGHRFNLDGEPVIDEVIDDKARQMARQQLALHRKRRVKKEAEVRAAETASQVAASEASA
jgi:sRNA-binding protein